MRVFGIGFRINPLTIPVLMILWPFGLLGPGFLLLVFALLHELAHVWMAKGCGLTVDAVELQPFGGVVRLVENIGVDPRLEKRVAIVGPLFSIGLGALAAVIDYLSPHYLLWILMQVNLLLGLVNLIPALPLDGGRLLRANLVMSRGYRRATELSIRVSRFMGWLSIIGGAVLLLSHVSHILLIWLGVFILLSLHRERTQNSYVLMRYLLARRLRLFTEERSVTRHLAFGMDTTIREAVSNLNYKDYHIIWILDRQYRVLGFLGESELVEAAFMHGSSTEISTLLSEERLSWPVAKQETQGVTPTSTKEQ